MKKKLNLDLPEYEDGKCPFVYPEETKFRGNQYLQSKIFKLKMLSFQKNLDLYDKEICLFPIVFEYTYFLIKKVTL